eukprot:CAMPEP_0113951390 /NCGR_PEP_ID=MMETSP1339-20121228/85918_1 /TAXON_ID=94617 /ORGANISM="Fibrocapsa japonica" /LENGTH=95 /DNA_ID=CAMNT_0000959623 /DNA_START=295 /DNA_END=579 /DNA_ORIENTATION=+ /assembly_acc=CAM_ASM_000762
MTGMQPRCTESASRLEARLSPVGQGQKVLAAMASTISSTETSARCLAVTADTWQSSLAAMALARLLRTWASTAVSTLPWKDARYLRPSPGPGADW